MSYWTQVRGLIVLRTFIVHESIKDQIESVLGKCIWDSNNGWEWDACTVPRGSEGSLHYWFNEEGRWDTVTIVGNLRDFGEEETEIESVVEWFRDSLMKFKELQLASVDSALLQLDRSRGDPSQVWMWTPSDKNRLKYELVRVK